MASGGDEAVRSGENRHDFSAVPRRIWEVNTPSGVEADETHSEATRRCSRETFDTIFRRSSCRLGGQYAFRSGGP